MICYFSNIRFFFCLAFLEFYLFLTISWQIDYQIVYHYCRVIRIFQAAGTLFLHVSFAFDDTLTSLLTIFNCFIGSFHFCYSHARVFQKTLAHQYPYSYSHTE